MKALPALTEGAAARHSGHPEPLPWSLTWFNDVMSGTHLWSAFPEMQRDCHLPRAEPAIEKPSQAPYGAESISAPRTLDRLLHASIGRLTLGLSPSALWLAYAD